VTLGECETAAAIDGSQRDQVISSIEAHMEYDTIRLARERAASEHLRELFTADLIAEILREGRVEEKENWVLATLQGHGLRITHALAPRVAVICDQVRKALNFTEAVEFFVHGSGELNCTAVPRMEEEQPHLIIINSALVEKLNDAELRFVLGHELGHLISRNSELRRIVDFVFPDENMPLPLRDKVDTWDKLSEMSADRFGYLAEPDLEVCLAVFFKLSSGLDTKAIRFDASAYLQEMDRVLEAFRTELSDSGMSHPVNPIRVKALQLFADSGICQDLRAGKSTSEAHATLARDMENLIELVLSKGHSPLVAARRRFIAAAGMLIAGADEKIGTDELDAILEPLAHFTHYPSRYFREMVERSDVLTLFHESTATILDANPSERFEMFEYMVSVALADRAIDRREIEMLFEVGEKVFAFQRKEVAQLLATAVQQHYVPRLSLWPRAPDSNES
jgi:uncharacterized tellurite resistance protein B-like protein